MPTVVLQHITKQYTEDDRRQPGSLSQVVTGGVRALFDKDNAYADYMQQMRTPSEPLTRPNAVADLSLIIRDGETLSILGPSGCGKTTLLKIIAGLMQPDSGDVLYDSVPIKDIPAGERGIGMVFQNYALYPHMAARENIGFFDIIHKQPEKIPERIRHISEVMGVEVRSLLSRKPPTLSGGEQQRVAIARCLARDPKIFLFDEPLSNLDAKLRLDTRVQIKRLIRHYQITSIYVTHDQTEAISLADRIAIMRDGKLEQVGTFQALYETPVNAFVAQFFGPSPMNLFGGHIAGDTWEGKGFHVHKVRPGLKNGQAVLLGIRPEHMILSNDGIPAKIDHVESILPQHRQIAYLLINSQPCTLSAPLEHPLKRGETIFLQFPIESVYLFDQQTGARIG